MGVNVFVSHTDSDHLLAGAVADRLRRAGFEAFSAADLTPGLSIQDTVRDALKRSDAVVAVMSRHSADSAWLMAEVGAAISMRKRLLTVRIDDGPLPDPLLGYQVLDAAGGSADAIAEVVTTTLGAAAA